MQHTIVTITGPSCTGKTTLVRELLKRGFAECVSTTTRSPRPGEVEGKDYYFVGEQQFAAMNVRGEFIETIYFGGNKCWYGMSAAEVMRYRAQGKPVVIIVEPNGMRQIRAWCLGNGVEHVGVFINNPIDKLLERFMVRVRVDQTTLPAVQAGRLRHLIEKELFWIHHDEYDLVMPDFDAANTMQTINKVRRLAGLSALRRAA